MELRPEEITKIIKSQIKNYENHIVQEEVGTVLVVGDGIARASGLEKCMMNELLEFPNGEYGIAQNLEENTVAVIILGDDGGIKEGDTVRRTGRVVSVPVGEALIGRVVNALGAPIDGKGPVEAAGYAPVESPAPGIIERQPVTVPLQTGIKAIDSMIPIGRGQRELIIGDRQTGKTSIALDTILNQKGNGVICVYVAIGQKRSTVAQVVETLTAGDRGLAGGYNSNVLRLAAETLTGEENCVVPIGKKAGEYFRHRGVELLTEDWLTAENLSVGGCFTLARHLAGLYRSGQVDAIELVFTRWNSLLSQEPCVLRLLPLPQPEKPAASDKRPADILYEPDCATVFNAMIPEYLGGVIYGALCESLASELSARRMAMDSATQNADEMIGKLNLQYNRARQGSITQELTEIVAGAEE